jgi:hypothetical protein
MLTRYRFDRIDLRQDLASDAYDLLACGRDLGQMFAAAGENLNSQLILQHANLLADARL